MNPILTFLLLMILIVSCSLFILYYLSTQLKKMKEDMKSGSDTVLTEWLKNMNTSIDKTSDTLAKELKEQRQTLDQQLKSQREAMNQQTKLIWERLDNAADVVKNVQKQLGGIQEFGKDMKDLSNILKSPKLRGGLGEQFLYELLDSSLPKHLYKTQYKFKDGAICDAVIFTEKGMIPVDSKFPMENFRAMLLAESDDVRAKAKKTFINDVKKRIDEIASKYLIPEESTTDQAVMYIPSENVYYEIIVNTQEIEAYAKQKNVVMASPNTLSYFLKVILVAYQQQDLAKHAGDILKALSGIKLEAAKFNEELGVLERHITNSYKSMDGIKIKFQKLFGKIEGIHALEGEHTQTPLLE